MSRRMNRGWTGPRKQPGFSMIEVLISLVLIAVAMLGAANMQLQALKVGKGASFRMHAVTLAMEIAERMEANRGGAITNPSPYATPISTTARTAAKDCISAPCSAAEVADFDLGTWEAGLVTWLPGARWSITNTTPGNPSTYSIVVGWQDKHTSNAGATDDQTAATDFFTYTMVRTVVQ